MPSPRRYTQEDIDLGLLQYWLCGHSATKAAEVTSIPKQTIHRWVTEHADRLQVLREMNEARYDKAIAQKAEGLQLRLLDTINDLIVLTEAQIKAGEVKNPDQAAQRLATVLGILIDKWLLMKGRPNTIVGNSDASEHLKALKARFPWLVVDSTAEEEQPPSLNP